MGSAKSSVFGGNGGTAFRDPDVVIDKGRISKIDICHGGEVDGFRLYYGTEGVGDWHGGDGGTLSTFALEGDELIIRVEGHAGYRIDRLQFFTDKGRKSPVYGGNGGKAFKYGGDKGEYLRTISGREGGVRGHSGLRIHQANLEFGLPYYLTNFKYDLKAVEPAAKPQQIAQQVLENNSSIEQTTEYARTLTLGAKKSFSWGLGEKYSAKGSAEIGVPEVADFKIEIGFEASSHQDWTSEDFQTQTESWKVPVKVPKHSKMRVTTSATQYKLENVPFTYDIVFYEGEKSNVKDRKTFAGHYSGVNYAEIKHTFEQL